MVKNPPVSARNTGSVPGSGRSPGKGSGNPLQYSCQGNPMDGGAWQATVPGAAKELDPTYPRNSGIGADLKQKHHGEVKGFLL